MAVEVYLEHVFYYSEVRVKLFSVAWMLCYISLHFLAYVVLAMIGIPEEYYLSFFAYFLSLTHKREKKGKCTYLTTKCAVDDTLSLDQCHSCLLRVQWRQPRHH